ncbi:protein phosphatase 1 regulatory subunit 3B-like isoform X2 [Adelges cooleyi]|uniref:protein phosphatase 1 regulatory subunit 3B-like isoform X2 n=2 Tax=Adelges cooleyi TaxID=133065 RepID=UPI0021801040|nr:protein phosphatase 1 regulatory subunit 3B-like isoform X2 [Adelges cooleyi]
MLLIKMYQNSCPSPTTTTTTTKNMLAECCDVMVAHSPPLFSTSHTPPPELSVLYQNLRLVMTQQQSPLSVRRYSNARPSCSSIGDDRQSTTTTTPQIKPRRPCLVTRIDSDGSLGSSSSGSSSDENEPPSPTRRKKKVVFADDRGLSLTQVRLMSEPSNQPPKSMSIAPYLNHHLNVSQSAATASKQSTEQWQLRFPQPASSYLDFRKRLDDSGVSLENVIVKSQDSRIVGTVKVRNLSYDKEVFVRCTHDKWTTFADTLCSYVQNNSMMTSNGASGPVQNVTAIYDTFSFRLPLPGDAAAMEFAVCYKAGEFEHWDNNDGANYCLSVNNQSAQSQAVAATPSPPPSLTEFDQKPVLFFGAQPKQNSCSSVWRDKKNDTYTYW